MTPAGPGGAGVGETNPVGRDESSEEDDVLDEDTPGRVCGRGLSSEELDEDTPGRFGGRGVSSEELDEDTPGRVGGRGVSSQELDEDIPGRFCGRGRVSSEEDEGVSFEGKEEDDEPATRRNAHSAKPLSLGAIGQ